LIQEFEKIGYVSWVGFSEDIPEMGGGMPAQKPFHRILKQLISSFGHFLYLAQLGGENPEFRLAADGCTCLGPKTNLIPYARIVHLM
jgi:hypothetical protein